MGKNITLANVLWCIDGGHHDSLESRGCLVPSRFKRFTGLTGQNVQSIEKRSLSNSIHDVLAKHVSSL